MYIYIIDRIISVCIVMAFHHSTFVAIFCQELETYFFAKMFILLKWLFYMAQIHFKDVSIISFCVFVLKQIYFVFFFSCKFYEDRFYASLILSHKDDDIIRPRRVTANAIQHHSLLLLFTIMQSTKISLY